MFVAGFEKVLRTSYFDRLSFASRVEGLKANPER